MRSIGPHLVANRFVPLIAAEHVDLATEDRVWLRQVHLDRVAGAGLSDVAARLFAMWHGKTTEVKFELTEPTAPGEARVPVQPLVDSPNVTVDVPNCGS